MEMSQGLSWASSDPSTADLLVAGGDARIEVDATSGENQYGCRPCPDARIAPFGSSTASTISPTAYAAAKGLYAGICTEAGGPQVYRRELDRVRSELVSLYGLGDAEPDIIFAASGTDIHLIVADLLAGAAAGESTTILPERRETGSGVPAALSGRHFSTASARNMSLAQGSPLSGSTGSELVEIPLRDGEGALRPVECVDADAEACVLRAAAAGRKVLLTLVDVSKTGVIAPSPACVRRLKRRLPDTVEVLVDACQLRLSGRSLLAYLQEDFLVAVTGSKFLSGPTFSGALLVPQRAAHRLRSRPLSCDLSSYSGKAEWPSGWPAAAQLPEAPNWGLLLRWEAAVSELRRFQALPSAEVRDFLQRFADAVSARLLEHPVLEPLPLARLGRGLAAEGEDWDDVPTIFPFLLRHSAPRTFGDVFTAAETAKAHGLLRRDLTSQVRRGPAAALPVEFGQPVACGERHGVPISALRICSSARLAVHGVQGGEAAADQVIATAMRALDKAALIARAISRREL